MAGLFRLFAALRPSRGNGPEPDSAAPMDWKAMGNEALGEGDLARAADCYRQAAEADPKDGAAWLNLGFCLLERGDQSAAETSLDRALALAGPGASYLHDVHYLRGRALAAQGRWNDARLAFEAAIGVRSPFPEAALGLAEALLQLKRPQDACTALDSVLAEQPDHAGAWEGRGTALLAMEQPQAALEAFQRALTLTPPTADLLANLAAALHSLNRFDEAVASGRQALAMDPAHERALFSVGVGLSEALRIEEAKQFCAEAFRIAPKGPNIEWNLGIARLLSGDLAGGWPSYESRLSAPEGYLNKRPLPPGVRLWRGEDLAGRTLLLEGEQGLGDTLMMLRYFPLLTGRAARVMVRVQAPLQELARQVAPDWEIWSGDQPLSVLPDFVCPLMSLPYCMGTTLETIPGTVPYLRTDPARADRWRAEVGKLTGRLKVGVAWAGDPIHKNNARRSMPLAALRGMELEDCDFVTVQPKIPVSALADWPQLHRFGDRLESFSDTAALLEALDLVVTVDTSVAHLAGALARPVWILLPHYPEWRWMVHRGDSPWYPTAKLYRQAAPGDWKSIVDAVRRDLAATAPASA